MHIFRPVEGLSVFVGKRVIFKGNVYIGSEVRIYGATSINANTIIDDYVTLGYPVRHKLLQILRNSAMKEKVVDHYLDEVSEGIKIGSNAIIRRYTIIYENVELGDNVETGHHVLIRENTIIGTSTKIGSGSIIDGNVQIGSNVSIQSGVYIPPGVRIGSNVFLAPRVVFTNDRYPPSKRLAEIVVEDDVVIGANSVIVAGIRIGRGAVIAAGSVVTKSIEPYTVVAGVPAKPIMSRDEYEKKKELYEERYAFPYK